MLECHLVSGDFDYLIKARIGEMADYRKLLGDILLQLPGAVQSKSYVVMEEIKETLTIASSMSDIHACGSTRRNTVYLYSIFAVFCACPP